MTDVFMILGDMHEGGFGTELSCFGIFDDLKVATAEMLKLQRKHKRARFEIKTITKNKVSKTYFGGYTE